MKQNFSTELSTDELQMVIHGLSKYRDTVQVVADTTGNRDTYKKCVDEVKLITGLMKRLSGVVDKAVKIAKSGHRAPTT